MCPLIGGCVHHILYFEVVFILKLSLISRYSFINFCGCHFAGSSHLFRGFEVVLGCSGHPLLGVVSLSLDQHNRFGFSAFVARALYIRCTIPGGVVYSSCTEQSQNVLTLEDWKRCLQRNTPCPVAACQVRGPGASTPNAVRDPSPLRKIHNSST